MPEAATNTTPAHPPVVEMDGKAFEQFVDERVKAVVGEKSVEEQIREATELIKKDHHEWKKKTDAEKIRSERAMMRRALLSSSPADRKSASETFTGTKGALFIALVQRALIDGVPPKNMAPLAEKSGHPQVARALSVSVSASGGILIPEEFADDFIGAVYNRVIVRSMGARLIQMPSGGKLALGKLTQSATFNWVDENAEAPTSEQTFGKETLEVFKGMVLVPISNDFLRRGPSGIEQILVDDITSVTAVGVDSAFIRGDGVGKPTGINTQMAGGQAVAQSGTTLAAVESDLIDAKYRVLSTLPNSQATTPGWIMNLRTKMGLLKIRTDDGYPIYAAELAQGMLMGDPVGHTNSIPVNLGVGTDESEVYYGDFAELLIGDTLQPQIETSTQATYNVGGTQYNTFQRDQSLIRLLVETDILLRRDTAFSKISGVTVK